VIRPTQRPLPDKTQHSQERDIHNPGGIPASQPPKTHALVRTTPEIGHLVGRPYLFIFIDAPLYSLRLKFLGLHVLISWFISKQITRLQHLVCSNRKVYSLAHSFIWRYFQSLQLCVMKSELESVFNPLKPELIPICYLLALLGAHHFLHVSRIRVKLLTLRRLMSYIYAAPIFDVSRSHTTTQHSR